MADMAAIDQLETCWDELSLDRASGRRLVPITYINSSAAIKAFVGERGGIVCTSTNCAATLRWAWERGGERILFLPDQRLGRNTAYKMGVALDKMVVWDPHEMYGGQTVEQLLDARMILWKGHCSVHERFTVAQKSASARSIQASESSCTPRCRGMSCRRPTTAVNRIHHSPGHRERRPGTTGPSAQSFTSSTGWRSASRRGRRCSPSINSLPVLDDVPRFPELSALDARRPAPRRGSQPNCRVRRAEALDESRARSDAFRSLTQLGRAGLAVQLALRASTEEDTRGTPHFRFFRMYLMRSSRISMPKTMEIHHGKHHNA